MRSSAFPYLNLFFKEQDRFEDAGVTNPAECHELCSSELAAVVDGILWQDVYEYLDSPEHQLDKFSNQMSSNSHKKSSGFHANIVYDFELKKWINVSGGDELNSSLWFHQVDFDPIFPILDDWIILFGTCIDYMTVNSNTVNVRGTVICNGDHWQTRVQQMSTIEEATQICGSKGLWFPMDTDTLKLDMNILPKTFAQFKPIWTGARRHNASHFTFNGTAFDVTNLESCTIKEKTGTFRSNVIMTRQWLSDDLDRAYAVSFA